MEHKISSELPPLESEIAAPNMSPLPERQTQEIVNESQAGRAVEAGAAPSPVNPLQQQVTQAAPPQPPVLPQPPVTSNPTTPIIADDSDLIEKEWVLKAKEIVARTRHDPYQQNKEVERIKADYMKKRYNKDIRVTED